MSSTYDLTRPPTTRAAIAELVRFAGEVTTGLMLPDGLYCFDRDWAVPTLRGRSPRYTLMVGLGFDRAIRAGYDVPRQPSELLDVVLRQPADLTPGDLGLVLWLASRHGDTRATGALQAVEQLDFASLDGLEGMEIGWLVTGAAEAVLAGLPAAAVLERALATLRARRASGSPLFRHMGGEQRRASLPNFATEIYTVLALARTATATDDDRAVAEAVALADRLVELRRDDRGWPWLFHADRDVVVEPYQVYSVHQDAMAPMAYFALTEATGDDRHARAAAEGLAWCFGANELAINFYDVPNLFAHRAIRRGGAADRLALWGNTALALTGRRRRLSIGEPAMNMTCRPYHLGWIIEAWAGREDRIELVTP